jgi:hypothetical protein
MLPELAEPLMKAIQYEREREIEALSRATQARRLGSTAPSQKGPKEHIQYPGLFGRALRTVLRAGA